MLYHFFPVLHLKTLFLTQLLYQVSRYLEHNLAHNPPPPRGRVWCGAVLDLQNGVLLLPPPPPISLPVPST